MKKTIRNFDKILADITAIFGLYYHPGNKRTNAGKLILYLEAGRYLLGQQRDNYRTMLTVHLAKALKKSFPAETDFCDRNLRYMMPFATRHANITKLVTEGDTGCQELDSAAPGQRARFLEDIVAKLSWYHHRQLLEHTKDDREYLYYLHLALAGNLSAGRLPGHINKHPYRQSEAANNFAHTLPGDKAALAAKTFRAPYMLDFVAPCEAASELALERVLVKDIKKFMHILGEGFAYIGNQYPLPAAGSQYFLDMLFYNFTLRCFVVVELKAEECAPEHIGKLNFYINKVDEHLKTPHDSPTIGMLLCKAAHTDLVSSTLKGVQTPIAIAHYQLSNRLMA